MARCGIHQFGSSSRLYLIAWCCESSIYREDPFIVEVRLNLNDQFDAPNVLFLLRLFGNHLLGLRRSPLQNHPTQAFMAIGLE